MTTTDGSAGVVEACDVTVVDGVPMDSIGRLLPPVDLEAYARDFLGMARESVTFIWKSGDHWLSVRIDRLPAGHQGKSAARLSWAPLVLPNRVTSREVDVLTLIALGLTNTAIAHRLGNSSRTVSKQVESLLLKLGTASRAGLASLAVDLGLLHLPIPGGHVAAAPITVARLDQRRRRVRDPHPTPVRTIAVGSPQLRPFRIGVMATVCAGSVDHCREVNRGSLLAIEEINSRGGVGGRTIRQVAVEVDMLDAESVAGGLHKLFDQGVDAIIADYVSADHPFVIDRVAEYGAPFLHTATFEEQVGIVRADPHRYGNIFQTCPSETYYGLGFIRTITQLRANSSWRPPNNRIISIESNSPSTHPTNDLFMQAAEAAGWVLDDVIQCPIGNRDWRGVVSQVTADDPAVLFISCFISDDAIALQRELHRAGSPSLKYYIYGPSAPTFATRLGAAADGVLWATVTGLYDDDLGRRFKDHYRHRFGYAPGWAGASAAYDQVRLLANSWAATGSRDPTATSHQLRSGTYRGLNGAYFLGAAGQSCLAYPDVSKDLSLSQAQMVYQYQGDEIRAIAPEPNGYVSSFKVPSA